VHFLIKEEMELLNLKLGRDKLFILMREFDLLIKPQRRYIQTTMSKHWLRKWPNLLKNTIVTEADDAWVSDITYIKTEEGTCYLNLITDVYSRKIVGYAIDDTMETKSMIKALEMATKQKINQEAHTIHHSDRGLQYCSKDYVELTHKNQIRLSMTENSDPYENALAERMNRTIKEEFGLNRILPNKNLVKNLVKESVTLYNKRRPHLALGMRTPEEVYRQKKSRPPEAAGIL
jgi:putative transposase